MDEAEVRQAYVIPSRSDYPHAPLSSFINPKTAVYNIGVHHVTVKQSDKRSTLVEGLCFCSVSCTTREGRTVTGSGRGWNKVSSDVLVSQL